MTWNYRVWLGLSLIYLAGWNWVPARYEIEHYTLIGTSFRPLVGGQEALDS